MNPYQRIFVATVSALVMLASCLFESQASNRGARRPQAAKTGAASGGVYPQFLLNGKPDHWISDQMPVKVWVSRGLTLDGVVDNNGIPLTNTSNRDNWPDLVVQVMSKPEQLQTLPLATGYSDPQYQAAVEGINMWKSLEREGLYSFQLTDNPEEADIYVFWTPHFVNKLGLALFENDIRGYTAVHALPYEQVQSAMKRGDLALVRRSLKPVVTFLRTQEQDSTPISYGKMRASAAHEFGHALGIADHSPNRYDLMSVYYGSGVISPNDAATMRYLYRTVPYYMP